MAATTQKLAENGHGLGGVATRVVQPVGWPGLQLLAEGIQLAGRCGDDGS
jgi:hypothetical protein